MEVKAFKGFRFNAAIVGDTGACISPPYDVIDTNMRQRLCEKSPCNIVRVIRPENAAGTEQPDRYARAGNFFNELLQSGALSADSTENMYGYVQDFKVGDDNFQRSGFVALGRLEEFGEGVKPHEKTLDGPKADRLKLTRATAAQFGQIFMLYDDPDKTADNIIAKASTKEAMIDFTDRGGVRHRLFGIDESDDVRAIEKMMSDKHAVIADGHHRYETALNYRAESENKTADYRMMTFVNMQNPGLIILPTHRLVRNLSEFDIEELLTRMKAYFEIESCPFADDGEKVQAKERMFNRMKEEFEKGNSAFGIYAGTECFYSVVLNETEAMKKAAPGMSAAAGKLDVNVLHKLVIEGILGIGDKQLASQSNIEYIKDIGDAIDKSVARADNGDSQAVFFMNPTRIAQVRTVAAAGEKMPQKSTFFYPKVYTGLVINKL